MVRPARTASMRRRRYRRYIHAAEHVGAHVAECLVRLLAAEKQSVLVGGGRQASQLVFALQELLFVIPIIKAINISL